MYPMNSKLLEDVEIICVTYVGIYWLHLAKHCKVRKKLTGLETTMKNKSKEFSNSETWRRGNYFLPQHKIQSL